MVNVKVLFFGATADIVGNREVEFDFANGTKSDSAFRQVVEKFPQLAEHSLLFALNQEYVNDVVAINSGDELAVFTAVSGG
jgi:molybdopterin converting factor small subunit